MRVLAMFTGGLDSSLAVRLVQAQGIDVTGLHVSSPLCGADGAQAKDAAAELGIELLTVGMDGKYCNLVRAPRLGRLQGVAPCLDCRVARLLVAREHMAATGAQFVVSGEVVGQRPRAAIGDLELVAYHAGLDNRLVRPLSARLLPTTRPETAGWIDRSQLLDLQGKSRKRQLELAGQFGLSIRPPRPDCPLLSQPIGLRLGELLCRSDCIDAWQLELLPLGRHVPLDEQSWIVVGRNQSENEQLAAHSRRRDAEVCAVATPVDFKGPTALLVGASTPLRCRAIARLIAQFGRAGDGRELTVAICDASGEVLIEVAPQTPSQAPSARS